MTEISEAAKDAATEIAQDKPDCDECKWYPRGCVFERVLYDSDTQDYCILDAQIIDKVIAEKDAEIEQLKAKIISTHHLIHDALRHITEDDAAYMSIVKADLMFSAVNFKTLDQNIAEQKDEIERLQSEIDAYDLAEAERNAGIVGECPHCGSTKGTWFDRSITIDDETGEEIIDGYRCNDCGMRVDEEVDDDSWARLRRKYQYPDALEKDIQVACEENERLKTEIERLKDAMEKIKSMYKLFPENAWHEDDGDCLFFHFGGLEESPDVKLCSPLDSDFNDDEDYWTHFLGRFDINQIMAQAAVIEEKEKLCALVDDFATVEE